MWKNDFNQNVTRSRESAGEDWELGCSEVLYAVSVDGMQN